MEHHIAYQLGQKLREIEALQCRIINNQHLIIRNQEKIMDNTTALTAVTAELKAATPVPAA